MWCCVVRGVKLPCSISCLLCQANRKGDAAPTFLLFRETTEWREEESNRGTRTVHYIKYHEA